VETGITVRIRIWPILTVGFGALVVLVALSGWLVFVRATASYTGISELHDAEHRTEEALASLRSDIAVSAILIRDFLLDPSSSVDSARTELDRLRTQTGADINRLQQVIPQQQARKLGALHREVDGYWRSLDPVFHARNNMRSQLSFSFIQSEILPRRRAALSVLAELEQLNAEAMRQRRKEIDGRHAGFALYVGRMVGVTLLIALLVAGLSLFRIYHLEQVANRQHRQVQSAEEELRRLSQQLVRAQEEERRVLSRDLHDQVGQVLTALRISLGNLELFAQESGARASQELELAKRLLSQALRATRDLAMGLRPAMLDDLGLEAALEWHVRQQAKVCGVPIALEMDGPLEQLSEGQRTCVYRIVQEALNNAAKHSRAQNIAVKISCAAGEVAVDVKDDGMGFENANGKPHGLGLLGIRERVGELGGRLVIESRGARGTSLSARFPLLSGGV
jgi:signal transduction histidine kinase